MDFNEEFLTSETDNENLAISSVDYGVIGDTKLITLKLGVAF
jgi:hypothetical protein